MIYNIIYFVMIDSSPLKSTYLITMLDIPSLFAVGDCVFSISSGN
jgi:hypothetical protein